MPCDHSQSDCKLIEGDIRRFSFVGCRKGIFKLSCRNLALTTGNVELAQRKLLKEIASLFLRVDI